MCLIYQVQNCSFYQFMSQIIYFSFFLLYFFKTIFISSLLYCQLYSFHNSFIFPFKKNLPYCHISDSIRQMHLLNAYFFCCKIVYMYYIIPLEFCSNIWIILLFLHQCFFNGNILSKSNNFLHCQKNTTYADFL